MSRRSHRDSPRSRLRMDDYPQASRNGRSRASVSSKKQLDTSSKNRDLRETQSCTEPDEISLVKRFSSPGRQKELDSVMKKARRGGSQSNYWNKKLLEVEEKDPNRWRHSGYKELYHGEKKKSHSRSCSRSHSKSRSKSRSRSRSRSMSSKVGRSSPPPRPRSPPPKSRPRRSPRPRTPPKSRRPPSPISKTRSESYTSDSASSCSDESCSLCSRKNSRSKTKERDAKKDNKLRDRDRDRDRERDKERERERERFREKERERNRDKKRPKRPSRPPPRSPRSRSRSLSVLHSRPLANERDKQKRKAKVTKRFKEKSVLKVSRSHYIKVESESESSSASGGGNSGAPRLSLSERFGRMAQWSVDRDMEHRNLRITAGDRLTVEMDSPPSPAYPPSLSSLAEYGSWDDVRVRYAYYKEQGYLRDLTLQDYIKWEQWWYKYQDWLENERYNIYRRRL